MKIQFFFLVYFVFALWQCGEHWETTDLDRLHSSSFSWNAIVAFSDNHLMVLGGDTYQKGMVATSNNGGQEWQLDSISGKSIYGWDRTDDQILACGVDGQFLKLIDSGMNADWTLVRSGFWNDLFDLSFHEDGRYFIAVGGSRFARGVLQKMEYPSFRPLRTDTIPQAMRCIANLAPDHFVAAGFGQCLSTTDGGQSWIDVGLQNADFTDVVFKDSLTGWLCSYYGGLWRTSDGGKNWVQLRHPNPSFPRYFFNALFIDQEGNLWVCGDNGTLGTSTDEGEHLSFYNLPKEDFQSMTVTASRLWLVSLEGNISSLSIN